VSQQQIKPSIIFIDLDNFKPINDQFGHIVGDEVLKQFANRVRQIVRKEDTFARLGGDEFIILIENLTSMCGPEAVTRSIQKSLKEPLHVANTTINMTCSMGVAICPDNGFHSSTLLQHADTALCRAKELGRDNCQFFTREMNSFLEKNRRVEHELKQAIGNKQFVVCYQAVKALDTLRRRPSVLRSKLLKVCLLRIMTKPL